MKELVCPEGKKPKTYRFTRLGLSDDYAAFVQRVSMPPPAAEPDPPVAEERPDVFLQEMQALRGKAEASSNHKTIQNTQSLSRLVRRVRIAVKRLAGRKVRKAIKNIIS